MNISLKDLLKDKINDQGEKPLILIFPFNLLSHYLRCIEIAEELGDNFRIVFAGSPRYNKWISEKGYETFSYEDLDADLIMEHSRRFDFSWMKQDILEKCFLQQSEIITTFKPDFVLGDASFTLKMAAEYCGVKMISLINGYMSMHYACTRRLPRAHPAWKYSQLLPPDIFDRITNIAEKIVFRFVHKPFAGIRKKYRLKKKSRFPEELQGDITLICDLPELFPQKDLPADYYVIDPLFYKSNAREEEVIEFISNGKPNILVSMGSTGDFSQLRWLGSEVFSGFNIIVSGKGGNSFKGENFYCREFINNYSVLEYMDLLICHGGNGTIYQALAHGVPVLACTSIFEQEYNMQRVSEMRLGELILPGKKAVEYYAQISHWKRQKNNSELAAIRESIRSNVNSRVSMQPA